MRNCLKHQYIQSTTGCISGSISTISELETYMIVAERIAETKDTLSTIDPENISAYQLAYAVERFDTAVVWSRFSKMPGQKFVMDTQFLKEACGKKLSEAERGLIILIFIIRKLICMMSWILPMVLFRQRICSMHIYSV